MAARGMFFGEGPTACPFVALENDRDRRSDEPDHRHRCYAEPDPAPRALAHQREYCLAPAFTSCPIFQDWAIRAAATPVPLRPGLPTDAESQPEWAAPPPWAARDEPVEAIDEPADAPVEPADAPVGAPAAPDPGLFPPPVPSPPTPAGEEAPVPSFLASRAGQTAVPPAAPQRAAIPQPAPPPDYISPPSPPAGPQPVTPGQARSVAPQREEVVPVWQRQPLQPAYPTLRSRFGSGGSRDTLGLLTRLLAIGAIVALIVVGIILAPGLLGGAGPGASPTGGGTATATPGSPTASPTPSPSPSPSVRTYTVAAGDTLFSIARRHGLTVEQLLAANPQITNPNVVQIGQVLNIPPDDFGLFTPTPEP